MKQHRIGVARSCLAAWGGHATFMPGAVENSKLYGLCLGCVWVAFGRVEEVPGLGEDML